MKILVFGGTTEGREFSVFLTTLGAQVVLSCATAYGRELMEDAPRVEVRAGRMNQAEMAHFIQKGGFQAVVDTTHPFATLVSGNIRKACDQVGVPYYRLLRAGDWADDLTQEGVHWVETMEDAVKIINKSTGNVFLTTGSKDLEVFTQVSDYRQRIWLRVIPMLESLEKALSLGYAAKNIICMQGPFSPHLNEAMFRAAQARYVVTKDSGNIGGFHSKAKAALAVGATLIVIARPVAEEGYEWNRLLDIFRSLLT